MRNPVNITLPLVALVLAAAALLPAPPPGLAAQPPPAEARVAAPDVTLEDLRGTRVSISDFHGSAMILMFWTTW